MPEEKTKHKNTEPPEDELTELKEKLKLTEKERDEYLSGWRRSKADYVNYKNEEMVRLEEVVKYGNADLVKECVDVMTNLDRALTAMVGTKEEEGVRLIRNQLEEMLKRRGLEKIPVEAGKPWNPKFQEVVGAEPGDAPPETVLAEIEPGYMLHGKVLKTAKVKVAK